ncbi:MAG TPA: type II CAAX endopeptidase family protein [Gaiellaceae bacterium]|nr:type II CAAX endopeptidase family protein [Gaiellaceae bacterium]
MQTTSSPTSTTPSDDYRTAPFVAWSAIAAAFVVLGFWSTSTSSDEDTSTALYDYGFAVGTIFAYGILIGLTFLIGRAYDPTGPALGLRSFEWRWVGTAIGLIILVLILASALEPVLHGGRDQGLSPEDWRPDRAGAFALNGVIVSTIVPFTEELFFRGLGVRALRFFGGIAAVVVTGVVFGLSHGILGALPPLVLFGIALGWVRLRADSVWPGVLAHGFYNAVGILVVYVQLAY